jgi:hypothetical protein
MDRMTLLDLGCIFRPELPLISNQIVSGATFTLCEMSAQVKSIPDQANFSVRTQHRLELSLPQIS